MPELGFFDPDQALAEGNVCLRCSDPSGYQYVVQGDDGSAGYLCPPCCALVDPERVNPETRAELQVRAQRSDEEWEALGWQLATVTDISEATR